MVNFNLLLSMSVHFILILSMFLVFKGFFCFLLLVVLVEEFVIVFWVLGFLYKSISFYFVFITLGLCYFFTYHLMFSEFFFILEDFGIVDLVLLSFIFDWVLTYYVF